MASFFNIGKEVFTNLEKHLQCQKCQRTPVVGQPRWYRCTRLHFICQECKENKRESKCACKEPIITSGHCPMIESLLCIKGMKFKCKNVIFGCPDAQDSEAIVAHESNCIYRLVKCPKVTCKVTVPLGKVLDHMVEASHLFTASVISRDLRLLSTFFRMCNPTCDYTVYALEQNQIFLKRYFA